MNRRTSLITAAAVAGAVFAGSAAVAANIGILSAADDDSIGNLSAAAAVTTLPPPSEVQDNDPAESSIIEPQVIDVYLEDLPAPAAPATEASTELTTPDAEPTVQVFNVDDAGTVSLEQTDNGLFLDRVTASDGWEWTSEQSSSTGLSVTFTSGDSTYIFYADSAPDGTIAARVDQPIVKIVQAPAPPANGGSSASATPATVPSSYDDEHDEREEDEHEEDDHDDHEGGDDDD